MFAVQRGPMFFHPPSNNYNGPMSEGRLVYRQYLLRLEFLQEDDSDIGKVLDNKKKIFFFYVLSVYLLCSYDRKQKTPSFIQSVTSVKHKVLLD